MKVSEIFYSLSGEGIHAGIPTIFVRLAGCNLRCAWCDTEYALGGGEDWSVSRVAGAVRDIAHGVFVSCGRRVRWILITGGEPLIQWPEVYELIIDIKRDGYLVEVETNGSIEMPRGVLKLVDSWNVDVKCPSSGMSYGSFKPSWLKRMRKQDQLKFVVAEEDLEFVRNFLDDNRSLRPTILVSPVIPSADELWIQRVAEFCKEQNVRMSLQIHKIIWGKERGR